MSEQTYLLYKIFSENGLLYIGRTDQPLQYVLHDHFFKSPMVRAINIDCVTKIEYASFKSEADLLLYEIYYINQLKPPLNKEFKAKDHLTISLPKNPWHPFKCKSMDTWKEEIAKINILDTERTKRKKLLDKERKHKKRKIFLRTDISIKEKQELWQHWLLNYYEPIRNEIL